MSIHFVILLIAAYVFLLLKKNSLLISRLFLQAMTAKDHNNTIVLIKPSKNPIVD